MRNRSTRRLFILLLVSIIGLNVYAQSLIGQTHSIKKTHLKAAERRAQKEKRQDTEFILKYGATNAQLLQIKAIRRTTQLQIKHLKNSKISKSEKASKRKDIRKDAQQQMRNILSPTQWKQLTYDRQSNNKKKKIIREIVTNHRKALRVALKQPNANKEEIQTKLEKQCKQQLSAYVNEAQANKLLRKKKLQRISQNKEFKAIPLSKTDKKVLARFRFYHQRQIDKLKSALLPYTETRKKRKAIDQAYYAKVKKHIGDARFTQWRKYHDRAFERKCKRQCHFTDQQWKQYINIKNETAGVRLKIRQSRLTREQKKVKIKEALARENKSIQEMLSVEQYAKWSQWKKGNKRT